MNWKKILIPPAAIYAAIFLFISALIGFKIDQTKLWVEIVSWIILIIGLYLAINYVKPKNWQEGLKYGIFWVFILFVLDLFLTVPFTGWERFANWKTYISYAFTILLPTLWPKK